MVSTLYVGLERNIAEHQVGVRPCQNTLYLLSYLISHAHKQQWNSQPYFLTKKLKHEL